MTNAQILTFSRRRGRPKTNRPQFDTGTPETVMKRLLGITTEVLDLYLEHNIITKKQHWCGIHLRWLYTLRHGVPSVKATNLSYTGDFEHKSSEHEDTAWRESREKEYSDAINMLSKSGHALLIMNVCIYNEAPKSLNYLQKNTASTIKTTAELRNGLDILAKLWERN